MGYCSITTIRQKAVLNCVKRDWRLPFATPPMAGIRQLMRKFPAPTALLTVCAIAVLSWSSAAPGVAQAQTANSCVTGGAVEDATNTGLISDCETLLDAWDTLAGSVRLNWSANNPITEWQSVTVEGTPKRVTELAIPGFRLTGAIPSELGYLANLQLLDLRDNQLTGAIPSELGDLANLQELNLSGNQLIGAIPSELGDLANLQRLDLRLNQLSGPIPTQLSSLANLISLNLSRNQLSGPIPTQVGSLANLISLDLGGNQLSGPIPTQPGSLANLRNLNLSGNRLSGPILPVVVSLPNLKWLNLSGNRLSGPIPTQLGSLANLISLDLGGNQLTGSIPAELGDLANLLHLLDLSGNQLTGPVPPELVNLSNLRVLFLANLSVCLTEAVFQLVPNLWETDIHPLPPCSGDDVVVTVDGYPQIYKDNVFVLPVAEDLNTDRLPFWSYAALFFEYFDEEFDFLIFVSNRTPSNANTASEYVAWYRKVMNDTEGIGQPIFSHDGWDRLQGMIHLSYFEGFSSGSPALHELMHRWGNSVIPPGGHWFFSSANGQLGGFDIADLVDHGDGKYSAGYFSTTGGGTRPYSPIELYLAGFIPPEEVPDLWVAEDGKWLRTEDGNPVRAGGGGVIFTATKVRTYTIEDIVSKHGRRIPDASQAQRDFRAAAILLIDEGYPTSRWILDQVSGDVTSFSYPGADEFDDTYNFWEATGGRGTIAMDGLSQFRKPATAPGAPTGLAAAAFSRTQIVLSWNKPSSYGGSAITSYDLRHIETSADETVDSNWTVVQDAWTTVPGARRYTVTGLSEGTQYDFQVRAVNAAGDGHWSETESRTSTIPSVCLTGSAVPDAVNNLRLVSECEALLAARDTLAGSATLNWSADTPITEWHGVTVEGTPERVTNLSLTNQGLTGAIPAELGDLANLQGLSLRDNQLAGAIPSELGGLANLQWLDLGGNQLIGAIPSELGDLANLQWLFLGWNQLTGAIPSELGNLANLQSLSLRANQLTGEIPSELGDLANLGLLFLKGNQLTGCIPEELRNVADNDLDELGLPFCDATNSSPEFPAAETGKRSVAENTAPGKNVGAPVEATDADNAILTYTLGGADAASFAIDSGTGQLTVGAGATLDYETKTSYTVLVTATDPSDASAVITVTITVTDVDLGPLGSRYDADNDEVIDGEEVLTAIVDYFDDVITRDDVLELISLYSS